MSSRWLELHERILHLIDKWNADHADWCCTKGCPYPGEMHADVSFGDNDPAVYADEFWQKVQMVTCKGECTCYAGPVLRDLRGLLD